MIRGVPYDAEVEYLESTGTQWIDTGIKYSAGLEMRIDLAPMEIISDWRTGFCGIRLGSYQFSIVGISSQKYAYWVSSTVSSVNIIQAVGERVSISLSKNKFSVSSDGASDTVTISNTGAISDTHNILVFLAAYTGAPKMKCFSFKLGRNGVLVRDFIPVRFTNEIEVSEGAMYDRVTRRLFRNQGTGAFLYGADVATPVMGLHVFQEPPLG